MDRLEKLKKDIAIVTEWRKMGKILSKEEQFFAESVADEMIALKTSKNAGVQLISRANLNFIKGQRTDSGVGSDAVGGITQDAVASGQEDKTKKPRVSEEISDVTKADIKAPKAQALKTSTTESGTVPKKTPDIMNIKLKEPENQAEGEPSSVADCKEKVTPKDSAGQPTEDIPTEMIGHNPNLPMPQKMAEDLVANAKWGIEIGAYVSMKEGIERQLGRKSFAEFIDTPEKYKVVTQYLLGMVKETEPVPVA